MIGVLPNSKVLMHFGYLPEEGDIVIEFILNRFIEKVSLMA